MVRPDGLVVGRENRKDRKLLRYAGQQHLITIAPRRSGTANHLAGRDPPMAKLAIRF